MSTTLDKLSVIEREPYRHRIVKAYRVKDAIGAYCLRCQRVLGDQSKPLDLREWRTAQLAHEKETNHQTMMFKLT